MISQTEPSKSPNFNQINVVEPEFLNQLEILPVTKYVSFGWRKGILYKYPGMSESGDVHRLQVLHVLSACDPDGYRG